MMEPLVAKLVTLPKQNTESSITALSTNLEQICYYLDQNEPRGSFAAFTVINSLKQTAQLAIEVKNKKMLHNSLRCLHAAFAQCGSNTLTQWHSGAHINIVQLTQLLADCSPHAQTKESATQLAAMWSIILPSCQAHNLIATITPSVTQAFTKCVEQAQTDEHLESIIIWLHRFLNAGMRIIAPDMPLFHDLLMRHKTTAPTGAASLLTFLIMFWKEYLPAFTDAVLGIVYNAAFPANVNLIAEMRKSSNSDAIRKMFAIKPIYELFNREIVAHCLSRSDSADLGSNKTVMNGIKVLKALHPIVAGATEEALEMFSQPELVHNLALLHKASGENPCVRVQGTTNFGDKELFFSLLGEVTCTLVLHLKKDAIPHKDANADANSTPSVYLAPEPERPSAAAAAASVAQSQSQPVAVAPLTELEDDAEKTSFNEPRAGKSPQVEYSPAQSRFQPASTTEIDQVASLQQATYKPTHLVQENMILRLKLAENNLLTNDLLAILDIVRKSYEDVTASKSTS